MTQPRAPRKPGKHLIIVESPHKAQTIARFLGDDYIVLSSKGHIRDLPPHRLGIDTEKGFQPEYVIPDASAKVVTGLRSAAKKTDEILLASDPDREGEAIAWHLREVLHDVAEGTPFRRIQYNEITPRAVRAALANPGDINMPRVDAQQARRLIDRIVGYKISPFIWRNIKGGSSAGRVQSVALRLVCERENEIAAFQPVPYWVLGVWLRKADGGAPFFARLVRINGQKAEVGSEEQATKILADLRTRSVNVASVGVREVTRHALPPFITSSLQRAASSVLGFTPGRTMSIAQKLYEGVDIGGTEGPVGLITYMRTDAPAVAREAQDAALDYITRKYGRDFRPEKPNFYRSGAKAQEAHEAIRPTDVLRTPASLANVLDSADLKLYDLIWRRFVASQMAPAVFRQRTVCFDAPPAPDNGAPAGGTDTYTFSATTTDVVFQGFLKVMELDIRKAVSMPDGKDVETAQDDDDEDVSAPLPELAEGERVAVDRIASDRKETKPPARYSEAMLIDTLEKNGIGRPSTYASIMETILKHNYVTRDRRTLVPTELGQQVVSVLVAKFPVLFDVGFTAEMETDLDKVESGSLAWTDLMNTFYTRFRGWLDASKDPPADPETVRQVLGLLDQVKEWTPAEKRGRHIYDDAHLAKSIAEQLAEGKRPVSRRQLAAIANMVWRYRSQIPDAAARLSDLGLEVAAKPENPDTPAETLEKLDLLLASELADGRRRFLTSLKNQAKSGRSLTQRQIAAVDGAFLAALPTLPDGNALATRFGISSDGKVPEPDSESPALLAALEGVTNWNPPVKRGRRTFDDHEFFASVKEQFARKGSLSDKQRAALRRMASRYGLTAAGKPAEGNGPDEF